jgi:activator of HSP90 ATPase
MKMKSIRQTATFKASPEKIYDLIMDEKKHAELTGSKVTLSNKPNGEFSVFDGYCKGYNIELVKGRKIVQAWHFAEDGWPDNHFSICNFEFEKVGDKTKLRFIQSEVPAHKVESLKEGWKQFYWDAIKKYLKAEKN